jgi:hypothetical protein
VPEPLKDPLELVPELKLPAAEPVPLTPGPWWWWREWPGLPAFLVCPGVEPVETQPVKNAMIPLASKRAINVFMGALFGFVLAAAV